MANPPVIVWNLLAAMAEEEARTGERPEEITLVTEIWDELKKEVEALQYVVLNWGEEPPRFNGARVIVVDEIPLPEGGRCGPDTQGEEQ